VAYRSQPRPSLLDGVLVADWLEIIAEHHLDAPAEDRERLEELRRDYPLVPHGLEMSIGSPDGLSGRYLEAVAGLVSDLAAPWFSDHLCFTRSGGVALGTLVPLPRTREAAGAVARNAERAVAVVGVPLLLENITYHLDMGGELTEAQFLCEILEHGDCGLLLDVTNLHVNSVNHRYDPIEFLNTIPLERVGQVHLAGGEWRDGVLRDSHSAPVHEEVWTLLEHVLSRTEPAGILRTSVAHARRCPPPAVDGSEPDRRAHRRPRRDVRPC